MSHTLTTSSKSLEIVILFSAYRLTDLTATAMGGMDFGLPGPICQNLTDWLLHAVEIRAEGEENVKEVMLCLVHPMKRGSELVMSKT